MKHVWIKNPFDKVIMAGVFEGLVLTVILIIYHLIFVESTGFPYTQFINAPSLIFGINILFLIIGPIYYGFTRLPKYGDLLFVVVFVAITIFLLLKVRDVQRMDNSYWNVEFRRLLSGLIILVAAAVVGLPFLLHSKKFRDAVI